MPDPSALCLSPNCTLFEVIGAELTLFNPPSDEPCVPMHSSEPTPLACVLGNPPTVLAARKQPVAGKIAAMLVTYCPDTTMPVPEPLVVHDRVV